MRKKLLQLLLAAALARAALPPATPIPTHARYCVVGAGPGGLQLAHYLASAGRDYVLLEQASHAGSFFSSYPRFRQLISINKREVGRNDSLDFALRHDWNSLLSEPSHAAAPPAPASSTDARLTPAAQAPALRFTNFSSAYYPAADDLVTYLGQWAAAGARSHAGLGRAAALAIHYGVRVARVAAAPGWPAQPRPAGARFLLTLDAGNATSASLTCAYLLLATGLQEQAPPPSANFSAAVAAGLVRTYASAPAAPGAYAGQRVLVLGHGNAAFEVASHALREAAYVHIAGRPTSRLALALETHYPGNVRALHAGILESYNLKSLDGVTALALERMTFAAAPGGGVAVGLHPATCTADARGRATSRCALRRPYDAVVAALGWRFARGLFEAAVRPDLRSATAKHPAATPRYESTNVQGLFFVGALAHGADYKRASGGFIHGFRHTARALHRMLEEEGAEEEEAAAAKGAEAAVLPSAAQQQQPQQQQQRPYAPWPSTRTRGLRALVALLLRRLNSAAGLYQMFGHLVDVFVLDPLPLQALQPRARAPVGGSAHAAMEAPWHFYDAGAAAAAAAGSDASGLAADVAALQRAPPPGAPPRPPHELASEAAVDAALAGALREEVPVGHAHAAARAWHAKEAARGGGGGGGGSPAEWLQLSLEYGAAPAAPGTRDPFALDRTADATLQHPERSHFLHPVLRYYSAGGEGCNGSSSSGSGAGAASPAPPCAPLATQHLIEDFHLEFSSHTAHILPLSRFVQQVGLVRARGGSGGGGGGGAPARYAPWPPPQRPHPFLTGLLTLLMASCDGVTALHWGGAAFAGAGEADGWWLKLSMAAEASLAGLRALAVLAVDAAPGVPLSGAEAAHTGAVRLRWAAGQGADAAGADAAGADAAGADAAGAAAAGVAAEGGEGEPPRPPPPPAAAAAAAAAASGAPRAGEAAFSALTQREAGLGVLVLDARAGACRVLGERLGVQLGGVRVFHAGGGAGGGAAAGSAVEVPHHNLTAAQAAQHIRAIFRGLVA